MMNINNNVESLPLSDGENKRIKMTISCSDSELIPKVSGAGKIFDGPQGRYQLMHNGIMVVEDGYCGRWTTELIKLLHGHHEPQEEKAFSKLLQYIPKNFGVMIELGCWWSYYSMWFQKEIMNAKNYLIEPDPNNLEIGKKNFKMNGMSGNFYNAAIGKVSRESVSYQCYESDNLVRQIPFYCVDDFIEKNNIKFVDLLLCDIQGYELEMLEGAENAIRNKKIRFFVVSTHHHSISNDPLIHTKCLNYLLDHGAYILTEHTITESYSGDGLIIASLIDGDQQLPPIELSRNLPRTSLFPELEYDLADFFQKKTELNETINSLHRIQNELSVNMSERGRVQSELDIVLVERDQLQSELSVSLSKSSRIQSELDIVLVERNQLQSELRAVQSQRDQIQSELEIVLVERNQVRSELANVILERDQNWLEFNRISQSNSYRLMKPFREIRWFFRMLLKKLLLNTHKIWFSVFSIIHIFRSLPLISSAADSLKHRFPKQWNNIRRKFDNNERVVEIVPVIIEEGLEELSIQERKIYFDK